MTWSGKIIGSILGFLILGFMGIPIGFIIGYLFDYGLAQQIRINPSDQSHTQKTFFSATFLIMGYIAKADGRVSEKEIQAARAIMDRLQLNANQRQQAIDYFNEGKQGNFDFIHTLQELKSACHGRSVLLQLFVELQLQAAAAEGPLSHTKAQILQRLCQQLNYAPFFMFEHIFQQFREQANYSYQRQSQGYQPHYSSNNLKDAYTLLGIESNAPDAEVKRAYRRMMSKHHPDKLVAKGLPEEMMKLATEKAQKIKAAYELICTARGI